jgi:hypothetical protein
MCKGVCAEDNLTISLIANQAEFELGDPIRIYVRYENIGDSAYYIEKPRNFGKDHFLLSAEKQDCRIEGGFSHFDVEVDSLHLFYAPLHPGERLEIPLPQFNDLIGMDTLTIAEKGEFRIQARIMSKGIKNKFVDVGPLWKGVAVSPEITIILVAPSDEKLSAYRTRLDVCSDEVQTCFDIEAIEFFRLVRDPQAAQTLRLLLRRDYKENPRIAEAVAHQGAPEDQELLLALAEEAQDSSLREYFEILGRRGPLCGGFRSVNQQKFLKNSLNVSL